MSIFLSLVAIYVITGLTFAIYIQISKETFTRKAKFAWGKAAQRVLAWPWFLALYIRGLTDD